MLPWGTCDSKVPKEPFKDQSFGGSDNAGTKADRWRSDQTSETVFIILQKCKDTGGRGAVQGNEVIREGLVGGVCGFRVIATLAP